MKITYIAISVIPSDKSNALQVMKTCEAIKEQEIDINLIIPVRFGGVRIKKDPFDFYKIKNRFKIKKIFSIDLIPFQKILGSFSFWVQNLSFVIFTTFFLLFKKSDVYYSRDALSAFVLSFFKKNIFYEIHRIPKSSFNKFIFKTLLKRINGLIVIAEELKNLIIKDFGFDSNKILVAHDGVDIEQFDINILKKEARQKLNWPIDKKIVCYTGSLQYVKGVDILIKAMDSLPEAYCYIVGHKASVLKGDRVSYKTDNEKIVFYGTKPHSLIPIILKAADVLIIPHRDLAFSFSPLKLFEYMVSKRPIVASKIKILTDVLGEDGAVFFKAGDSNDLSKKIRLILDNKDLTQKITRKAFQEVRNYNWFERGKIIKDFILKRE